MAVNNIYLSLRIAPKLKKDFNDFCKKSGISMNAAVTQLAIKSIEKGSIPFIIKIVDYDPETRSGETKRTSIRIREDLREGFHRICKKTGISMSMVIKIFMMQCIDMGRFPFDI